MKTKFTPVEIIQNKGCYSADKVNALEFMKNPVILLEDIMRSNIPFEDKLWYLRNKCQAESKELIPLGFMLVSTFIDRLDDETKECYEYAKNLFFGTDKTKTTKELSIITEALENKMKGAKDKAKESVINLSKSLWLYPVCINNTFYNVCDILFPFYEIYDEKELDLKTCTDKLIMFTKEKVKK